MSLSDAAESMAADYKRSLLGKRWQSHLLAAKLVDLRRRRGLTQAEVASRAEISESAVRNYEQQKSAPKPHHLEALAKALDVRPEALRVYAVDSAPANCLFQLGEVYGLEPGSDPRFAYLRPTSAFMRSAIHKWAVQYGALRDEDVERGWYEDWKDRYHEDFNPEDFPQRYERTNSGYVAIEPWTNVQFAAALQRLRKERGLRQEDLADATGISRSTIRSYEQRSRLPKNSQLEALAEAFGVTEGSLTFFDFGSPVQATHALFQIANVYGLVPDEPDGIGGEDAQPVLRTVQPGLERIIDQWAEAKEALEETGDEQAYQAWKDSYDPESSESVRAHATSGKRRYRPYFDEDGNGDGTVCSDYDGHDGRFRDGFLRA